jgi:hypothetical protein
MRNILMTVMLLIVVVVMFNAIIADPSEGTRALIVKHGEDANDRIKDLSP